MQTLADLLLEHRLGGTTIQALPDLLQPATREEVYAVQDAQVPHLGPITAWKVTPMPESGEPACSPIPASCVHPDAATLSHQSLPGCEVEVEIAFLLGKDLPARPQGYSPAELLEAMASVHVALEIVSSRFADRQAQSKLTTMADMQSNGAIILGSGQPVEQALPDLSTQGLSLSLDQQPAGTATGGKSSENLLAALNWLTGHAGQRGLPLQAGTLIITGARIGPIPFQGHRVEARAAGIGEVSLQLS